MNSRRLLHTTAIRLSLRYALLYAVLIALGLGLLYWATSGYVDAQVASGLEQKLHDLQRIDRDQGRHRLITVIEAEGGNDGENRRYYLLLTPQGRRQAGRLGDWPPHLKLDGRVRNIWIEDELIPGHVQDRDGYWPMVATTLADGSRLLVAQSVREAEDLQEFILSTMAAILAVSVGLALTMGWWLGRTLLERIDSINATAQAVTGGELSRRAPLSGKDDEFDELAGHLNAMLERIELLLTGMRQVTDNVAHDLRRPLSRLRNRLEVTLLEARDTSEYRRVMEGAIEDADELIRAFNALLEIAQAEAGSFRGEWGVVDLSALLEGLAELYRDLAEARGKRLEVAVAPGLSVKGNRHLLAQAISNLLDNAIKYSADNGRIRLAAEAQTGGPSVLVSDNGPGIPPCERERVLERFARLDTARSTPGNGLGLSLIKAVAELHGADLLLGDNGPGLCVTLSFP